MGGENALKGVGEFICTRARLRGLILFVDTDRRVKYYPSDRMPPWFLRLLNRHYYKVKYWLITEAITVE